MASQTFEPASLERLVIFTWSIPYLANWAILITPVTISCKSYPLYDYWNGVINSEELKQATIDLNVDLVQAIIDPIGKLNATVADGLEDLADNFQYEKLLALIQRSDNRMDTDKHR